MGLFYDASDSARFYAALAKKSRLPTLKDRYSARLGTFMENPTLRPESSVNFQAYGWERGWALWSQIAANAVLIDRGATFVTDEVGSGRCAIGVSIDFFVTSAIANSAALRFVYPLHTGVNQANAAITSSSPNPEGAKVFVDFLLSQEGQKILTHPDIRRLPVRPSTYETLPATLLEAPPLTEPQANDNALLQQFSSRLEGNQPLQVLEVERTWQAACTQQRNQARRLLDEVGA